MGNLLHKILKCPSCGHDDFDPEKECACGYSADENFIIESFIMESEKTDKEKIEAQVPKNYVDLKSNKPSQEIVIKEIGSWVFTFSQFDNCVCLSTPALQSFRLKIKLNDLEELVEFMYRKTGKEKTTRKLQLSDKEISDLINKVNGMIEEKKSKIAVEFTSNELKELKDLIYMKLRV